MEKKAFRKFLLLSILFVFICTAVTSSWAIEKRYPSRYIELIYGFSPGGATEVHTRLLGKALEKHLGVPIIAVSKAGGGGVIAATAVINSPPDGYTIANMAWNCIIQTILLSKGAITFEDVKIAGQWNGFGTTMCVPTDSSWKTAQEFIDFLRKNPGVKVGIPGAGSSTAIRLENLNRSANLMMVSVPFKGEPEVITAILGKHVPIGNVTAMTAKNLSEAGKLRILFSLDPPTKFGLNPNIPSLDSVFGKSVADKDIKIVGFLLVPRKTPDEILTVLEEALEKACKDPELISGLEKTGSVVDFYNSKTGKENLRRMMERVKEIQQ